MEPNTNFSILSLLLVTLFVACIIPEDAPPPGVQLDLSDPRSQAVLDFQDQRLSDSLLVYLSHPEPTYRFLAARAFGSYQAPIAVDSLLSCLNDPFDLVREQVVYALGQQEDEKALPYLIEAFESGEEAYRFSRANGAILEAVGKLGGKDELELLTTIDHYLPTDTLLLAGQARGIMQLARNDEMSRAGTEVQIRLALDTTYPLPARIPAAAYLARFPLSLSDGQLQELVDYLALGVGGEVDRQLAKALARMAKPAQYSRIERLLDDEDAIMRVQTINGLQAEVYEQLFPKLRRLLVEDDSHLVRVAIGQWLLANGRDSEATLFARLAKDSLQGRERYLLYAAAHRHLPYYLADYRTGINGELRNFFEESTDPYEQAQIINAMGEFPWNYRSIHDFTFTHEAAPVRKAGVEAIRRIANFTGFDDFFGVSRRRVRTEISVYLREAISSQDIGMVYEAALAIKEHPEFYQPYYQDIDWARNTLAVLSLPEHLESHFELSSAIEKLEGRPAPEAHDPPVFNHPIDWSLLNIAGSDPEVRIRTSRGNLTIRLFPDLAPGTVAAFIQLVNDGFYTDLAIHRVAPAWVTQGGDPLGHGIGAGDFSIRTETPPIHYDRAGRVGAPRLGRDTESVQFFITHGATPVLDGRYTIFGQVTEGLDILEALRIGDRIERAELR